MRHQFLLLSVVLIAGAATAQSKTPKTVLPQISEQVGDHRIALINELLMAGGKGDVRAINQVAASDAVISRPDIKTGYGNAALQKLDEKSLAYFVANCAMADSQLNLKIQDHLVSVWMLCPTFGTNVSCLARFYFSPLDKIKEISIYPIVFTMPNPAPNSGDGKTNG